MTRTEAMAIINAALPVLDDARVETVAAIVQSFVEPKPFVLRDLTGDELAAIERSKEDFKAGRTYTPEQYKDEMDAFMARLADKYPASS